MRLSPFIRQNLEVILVEWESFARSQNDMTSMLSGAKLRDHAKLMLEAIATDIEEEQTAHAQAEKSRGDAPVERGPDSAASEHGTDRHGTGFSLVQLMAEFRAVRASVLRLWLPTIRAMDEADFNDMVRFNEAVDQAIAESVDTFSTALERTRDTFLGMLGHDLRGPLQVMTMAGSYLVRETSDPDRRTSAARRIVRSAALMSAMVNDLLDYARTQLGGAMSIETAHGDLRPICAAAVGDARAVHPQCTFELEAPDAVTGLFDGARLLQSLSNFLNNAAQYRTRGTAVTLRLSATEEGARLEVHNFGDVIPPEQRDAIFEPLVQLEVDEDKVERPGTSIGLGLFIARKIVEAHNGTMRVESDAASGTTFGIDLPASPG